MFNLSALSSLFSTAKIYLIIAGLIASLLAGGGLVWKYESSKIKIYQAEIRSCEDANKKTNETVARLQKDAKDASDVCADTLHTKDATIKGLRKIQYMKGASNGKVSETGAVVADGNVGDDILAALNGMYAQNDNSR